jgi:hypothetical protein
MANGDGVENGPTNQFYPVAMPMAMMINDN